jgi:hypothetical protein
MLYGNDEEKNLYCSTCSKNDHIEKDCPDIHFVADKEFIIKS